MKMINLEQSTLDICVHEAQNEHIIITRKGRPVALIVGLEGLDEEQLELGSSDKFWKLIAQRRQEETMDRAALEKMINEQKSGYGE
jgi:antitoxin (DNA-binding transcriptional repressor) of toxin-antitoxin stability system